MPISRDTPESGTQVRTIGHSNRTAAGLIEILQNHAVRHLIDIRAHPRSRRNPHFNRNTLERSLGAADIAYSWRGDALGGFRRARTDSVHTALDEAGFRGFADYMGTGGFADAVSALIDLASKRRIAIMCAEADYRSCHRRFIADALELRGIGVLHLTGPGTASAHELNPCLGDSRDPPVYNRHVQGDLFA